MDSEEQTDASFPQVHESDKVSPIISLSNINTENPEKQEEVSNRGEVIFRGIEFLERDPGLRPQIWEYPINQRDEVRRAYLKLGPMQPQLDEYKPSGPPGHKRRFQYSWFKQYPSWLEYSVSKDCAYCFVCFLFSSNLNKRSGFDVFTVQGYSDWKRVRNGKKCAFLTHVGSTPCSDHNNALRSCQDLLNQSRHVENIINVHTNEEREKNRLRLKVSVAAVRWLTFQGCAFRGHNESIQSRNRGNFLQLVKLLAEFNPNVEKVVMENAPGNSKYTSPDIQKEILSIYAVAVRKHIRDEIGDSKFSIIVDETCDVAKREQMALVLRFVDGDGVLQERFFDVIHVKNTKAMTLKDELCSVLRNHSLDIKNLRGQGYDGSSNMKGELNGLQALFLRECPYAYYVHCYAHRLQLALVAASNDVVPVCQFFQKLLFIVNTVDSSAKRHDELRDSQVIELAHLLDIGELETGQGANQVGSLQRPGDTRWGSHLKSISSLMNMFNAVSSVLQNIAADGSSGSIRADGDTAFGYLVSFEFVFILCLMKEVLGITDMLCQTLQTKTQDIVNAIRTVASTKQLLQNMREDGWNCFFMKVKEFCEKHDIDVPDMEQTYILRGGRARRQPDHFTNERFFRIEVFLVTIDTQLQELNYKFNEKVMDLLSIMATLVPRNEFRSFNAGEICKMVEKYYPEDFSLQDRYVLENQLNHFVLDISQDAELRKIGTITELCRCLIETSRHTAYNLVDRLLRLLVTLPVSTASAERAFSALKIIKTRLRSKMEDEFLSNSLLVYIEGGIAEKYDYDDIIQDFKNLKTRRADL
ncbi:uncharacterized protein LOC141836984 [Curcuma longa]|uniref:uncharacterized protein LOC141836984 n=1 Tax=Curcuma longa TaxID=136217 RepID=UPI003D9E842C